MSLSATLATSCLALVLAGCRPATDTAPEGGAWIIAPEGPAHIYVPLRPTDDELEAAGELARILAEMSDRPAFVLKEPFLFHKNGFYVGDTQAARNLLPQLVAKQPGTSASDHREPLPPERWDNVGWAVEDGRIIIAGSTPLATRFAVSKFAEENCGARWWFPGEDGEDIPKVSSLPIRPRVTVEKPSYVSRFFSTNKTKETKQWFIHSALVENLHGHHSLNWILNKDVAREHPDWFPCFDGKPYHPDTIRGQGPHPDYLNTDAAQYVADKAMAFFDENPGELCFSISPPDNTLFGDLDAYKGLVDPTESFRGKANLSNAIFTFDNRVAKAVARKYPDRYLGALAYAFYEDVPDFPVEPNIVPVITADRSQWYDRDFRAEDLALVAKWAKAGPKIIASWDYYEGYPYLVPRVMISAVKDSIPSLHEAGLRAFYGECAALWGFDAPKFWIAAHLLWNCDQNPDLLEKEFYTGCYGPAAPEMEAFFKKCDTVWMNQGGTSRWIRYYGDFDQAAIYTAEDVRELRAYLDAALARELPEKTRRRVELVANAFSLTERLMTAHAAARRVSLWQPGMDLAELEEAIPAFLATRIDVANIGDKVLPLNKVYQPGYLTDDDPLSGRLILAAPTMNAADKARIATLAPGYSDILEGRISFLLKEPFKNGLKHWLVTQWPNPDLDYSLVGEGADATLSVAKANTFCLMLKARVKPGRVYGMAFGADGCVSASASVQLTLEYLGADGKTLSFHADSLPYGNLENAPLAVAGMAPEGTATTRVTLAVKYQGKEDIVRLHAWRAPVK